MSRRHLLLALVLGSAACQTPPSEPLEPSVPDAGPRAPDGGLACDPSAWPERVDFGDVRPGLSYQDQLYLDEGCLVRSVAWVEGSAEGFTAEFEDHLVTVRFQSVVPVAPIATLQIQLEDGTTARVRYQASNLPPELDVHPEHLRVPATGRCASNARVTLSNRSEQVVNLPGAPLVQGEFQLSIPRSGLPERVLPGRTVSYRLETMPRPGVERWDGRFAVEVERNGWTRSLEATLEGYDASDPLPHTETFTQRAEPQYDFLFVVDDGPSMASMTPDHHATLDALAEAISRVPNTRVAVLTTTQIGVPRAVNGRDHARFEDPDYLTRIRALLDVGTGGATVPMGLESAAVLLERQRALPPEDRILRDEAQTYYIFISNREDASPGRVDQYEYIFRQAKNNHRYRWSSHAVTSMEACTGRGGSATGGARYIDLVDRMEGFYHPICDGEWRVLPTHYGWAPREALHLGSTPIASTLEVGFEGAKLPEDRWRYDPEDNVVYLHYDNFRDDAVPRIGPGDAVEVSYEVECP